MVMLGTTEENQIGQSGRGASKMGILCGGPYEFFPAEWSSVIAGVQQTQRVALFSDWVSIQRRVVFEGLVEARFGRMQVAKSTERHKRSNLPFLFYRHFGSLGAVVDSNKARSRNRSSASTEETILCSRQQHVSIIQTCNSLD